MHVVCTACASHAAVARAQEFLTMTLTLTLTGVAGASARGKASARLRRGAPSQPGARGAAACLRTGRPARARRGAQGAGAEAGYTKKVRPGHLKSRLAYPARKLSLAGLCPGKHAAGGRLTVASQLTLAAHLGGHLGTPVSLRHGSQGGSPPSTSPNWQALVRGRIVRRAMRKAAAVGLVGSPVRGDCRAHAAS